MIDAPWFWYAYYGFLLLVGPISVLLVNRVVQRTKRLRKLHMQEQGQLEAVPGKEPREHVAENTRKDVVQKIGQRFTIIERLSIGAIILLWVFFLVLPHLGKVSSTVFSILVGSSAVVVGIAARPFIENLISGIIISFSKPFRTGDTVMLDQQYGIVEDITLTFTIVKIWNWRRYIIPNSQMLNKSFVNYTIKDTHQWMHVEFWVAYDTDLKELRQMAMDAAGQSPNFSGKEPPSFWIMEMGKEGYRCWIAAWADNPSTAWELGHDIRTRLVLGFQAKGIKAHNFHFDGAFAKPPGL